MYRGEAEKEAAGSSPGDASATALPPRSERAVHGFYNG
jgi:hypothetical protein